MDCGQALGRYSPHSNKLQAPCARLITTPRHSSRSMKRSPTPNRRCGSFKPITKQGSRRISMSWLPMSSITRRKSPTYKRSLCAIRTRWHCSPLSAAGGGTPRVQISAAAAVLRQRTEECRTRKHFRTHGSLKNLRTFSATCGSAILSAVSMAAIRAPSPFASSRFFSSTLASPGPKMNSDSASATAAITAS